MNKVVVIVGPTGVGKTKLSIKLAKIYNGEIINGDSMQIYKELDIGTAKVTQNEKENIKHHLFDIKEVTDMYTVYNYQQDCRAKIAEIITRKKLPIIVGGTGLYIKAALYNYELDQEDSNSDDYNNYSNNELYQMVKDIDNDTTIHQNNRQRLIRYLNKENKDKKNSNKLLYNALFIGLTIDRKLLYEKINKRVDIMLENGLIEEVLKFYQNKIKSKAIMTGIGYKELYQYFDQKISLVEAIALIKRNSRRYAKRQYTWFNNQIDVKWFEVDNNFDSTVKQVKEYIEKEFRI